MPSPIFYFQKLNRWDKVTLGLYVFITIALWYCYESSTNNRIQGEILFAYPFFTQLFLYLINYKSLRNLTVYCCWVAIGMFHCFIYFQLKDVVALRGLHYHAAVGFRNTIILLFLFQVLRFISAKTQGMELVCPSRGSGTDFFDERKITFLDYLFMVIYLAGVISLNTV